VLENAIQTDAAINRGNSGGALADINGNLVGINTAIASTSPGGGSIGIGFAIPSNTAVTVANQIIKRGKVVRPWVGIVYMGLDDTVRQELKEAGEVSVPPVNGALIRGVIPGSPADRAGLRPLDVITEINSKRVTGVKTIADEVTKAKVGQIIDLTVWHARTSKSTRVAVRTAEMPASL
jgi:S1-C subfamily serine protease